MPYLRVLAFLACTHVFAATINFVPLWLWTKTANRQALRRAVDRFGRDRAKALVSRRFRRGRVERRPGTE